MLDSRLQLSDAEYDTQMGEAAMLSMQRLTNPIPEATTAAAAAARHGTKRRSHEDADNFEAGTALALAQFKDQKQAIETSGSTKRLKKARTGQPDQADEEQDDEEEEAGLQ
jgi:hypothetical protein